MPAEKFDSPVMQAAQKFTGGVKSKTFKDYIIIEGCFSEDDLLELARAVIAAHAAATKKE